MQPPSQSASLQQPQSQGTPSLGGYQANSLSNDRIRPQQAIQAAPAASTPRSTGQSGVLSRLNTNELQVQAPAAAIQGLQISNHHPLQQTQNAHQDQPSSSPTIYFHHYIPPGQSKDKDPGTPAVNKTSPQTSNPNSHRRADYTSSPKKRKATGEHKPPPEPSPVFSQNSSSNSSRRRPRSRHPSDASTKGLPDFHRNRTDSSRQSFSEAESGRNSVQPETRHRQPIGSDGRETNHVSRGSSNRDSPQ